MSEATSFTRAGIHFSLIARRMRQDGYFLLYISLGRWSRPIFSANFMLT